MIGDLNRQITLQYETKVSDDMGGFTSTWIDVATIWAAMWPISANEQIKSMQETMTITSRIVNVNEANEWLDLMVKEAT